MNKTVAIFLFSGVAVIVLNIVLVMMVVPKIVNSQLKKNLALQDGSDAFKYWKKIPVPITFGVYIFNVTNPENVSMGQQPKLVEVGPYVYDEYMEKIILDTDEINDTVTFMRRKTFYFNKTLSGNLKEEDNVTVLNFAYIGLITKVNDMIKGMMSVLNPALPAMFKGLRDPFLRATVGEVLFKGTFLNCSSPEVELICDSIKINLPPTMKVIDTPEKKGLYVSMIGHTNGTDEGPLVANRGTKDLSKLGKIESYKGEKEMSIYKGKCAAIRGTDATIFSPMDRGNVTTKLFIFEPSICRSMYAELKDLNETLGLKSYRYEATTNTFAGKCIAPENECFCLRNWSSVVDSCSVNGVHDMSPCQQVPVIASYPHFYLGSEELLKYAEGLKPIKEKHETFVELERLTSVPLRGKKRLQFNMQLEAQADVPIMNNVSNGLFPIMWIEEAAEVPTEIAENLKIAAYMVYVLELVQWLPLFIGVFLIMGSVFFYFKSSRGHLALKTNSINYIVNTSRDNGIQNSGFGNHGLSGSKSDSIGMK